MDAEQAASINWRINSAGYVEGRLHGRSTLQHRFIVETLVGDLQPALHVHHVNGCKTDNRPGNLMVIAPGPHAWETSMRSAAIRASAQAFVDAERQASGGLLSAYGHQLESLLRIEPMEADDTSWQRIGEHGFWTEGDVTVAAAGPVQRWKHLQPPRFQDVLEMPDDHPDKAFLRALHVEKMRRHRDDAAAVLRGGLR